MTAAGKQGETAWVRDNVARYAAVRERWKTHATVLQEVLERASKKLAPYAIVQARPKALASFAEKIQRKRKLYRDPLVDMTDLCGGRVITYTADQVRAVCAFIEKNFDIDWENSADVSQRLRPAEFGYRSVHYIVLFRRGVFPSDDVPVTIPEEVYGLKAEVQVRTILEHAWAAIGHDMTYKSALKVPAKYQRDFAAIAASLEAMDREFSRIQNELQTYVSSYGLYLKPDQVEREIEVLRLVLECDPKNAELACRAARLAMSLGHWGKVLEILTPYVATGKDPGGKEGPRGPQPVLRDLGVALCKLQQAQPYSAEFARGYAHLEAAAAMGGDPESLLALAEATRPRDQNAAQDLFRRAFDADPSHPDCVNSYLENEISRRRDVAVVSMMGPALNAARERCRRQIEAEVNLPGAYLNLGKLCLLLGQAYDALSAFAKAVRLCSSPDFLLAAQNSLASLEPVADKLPGFAWARMLLQLARAAKYPGPETNELLRRLATGGATPIKGPVVIVAGGCHPSVEQHMQQYRQLLLEAFRGFSGTIVGGGTREGIAGLAGDVRQAYPGRVRNISYVPRMLPADAQLDRDTNRYDEIRKTEGVGFTPAEPLQNWIDMLASGVTPSDVKLLGLNGGDIAAAEYRIALALGAKVGLVEGSGRQAARIFDDPDWNNSENLLRLPEDTMTIRAFVGLGASRFPDEHREAVARAIHQAYRRNQVEEHAKSNPSLKGWDELPETLKHSNRAQADHIFEKLTLIGCGVRPLADPAPAAELTADEVERLAEFEHGRWNAERLAEGWRWAEQKDVARKLTPYLVPWSALPDGVKKWDRDAVREIPALLAQIGLKIARQ